MRGLNLRSRKVSNKLVSGLIAIEEKSAKEAKTVAYMARAMVNATLPHSKPKDNVFQRTNGNFTLSMIGNPNFGLPYGSLPRLLLAWLTREAKVKNSPVLNLGKNYSAFLNTFKLSQSGGVRGDATRLREQMLKLFTTHISCIYRNNKQGVCKADQFSVTRTFKLWWNPIKDGNNNFPETSVITLAKDFFEEIITRPVPVDFRMLQALRRSPLQMDIYVWLTYRFSNLKKPAFISWSQLNYQFGPNFTSTKQNLRDFKREFIKALHIVLIMYKEAKVEIEDEGITLKPSRTHVARNVKKEGNIT